MHQHGQTLEGPIANCIVCQSTAHARDASSSFHCAATSQPLSGRDVNRRMNELQGPAGRLEEKVGSFQNKLWHSSKGLRICSLICIPPAIWECSTRNICHQTQRLSLMDLTPWRAGKLPTRCKVKETPLYTSRIRRSLRRLDSTSWTACSYLPVTSPCKASSCARLTGG